MAKMTKVLRRQLSADERVQRFFELEKRQYSMEMMRRFRLARVEQDTKDGVTVLLPVRRVIDTGAGLIIKVG